MQLKFFGPLERKSLLGMALVAFFTCASIYQIGKRNFWFEPKNIYFTRVADADGLRVGSIVTIAGLRVGEVSSLEVDDANQIAVTMTVRRTVAHRLRTDALASISRAFIIGDKKIELLTGDLQKPELPNKSKVPARDRAELTDFITGKKLAELMGQIETLIGGVTGIVHEMDGILGKYHAGEFTKTLTMVDPALQNFIRLSDDLLVMTKEMKKKSKEIPILVESGAGVLSDVRHDFLANNLMKDSLEKVNQVVTPLAERRRLLEDLLSNLQDLSRDLTEHPNYTKEVLGAVNELTITLKALQKTWFLEDKATEARDEKRHGS